MVLQDRQQGRISGMEGETFRVLGRARSCLCCPSIPASSTTMKPKDMKDLVAIQWVDITEYSGWSENEEHPTPFWSVGFLHYEDDDWIVLTDTQPKGSACHYPRGCIKKMVKLTTSKLK